ncbi:MAG: hypothetical protein ACOYL6_16875 [Bacteriovoracaceae bacterium]
MKKLLIGLLALGSISAFATDCESEKLVIESTKKAMAAFSQMPEFAEAKKVTNYKISAVSSGDNSKASYAIAALDKNKKIIALGTSEVDVVSCDLVVNPDGSVANSLSFSVLNY